MSSTKTQILDYLIAKEYNNNRYNFDELIKEASIATLGYDSIEAENFATNNSDRLWKDLSILLESDSKRGIYPLFIDTNNYTKELYPCTYRCPTDLKKRKFNLLNSRSKILKKINSIDNREYEALGCVASKLLGASHIKLTPPGNEAGIDFIASIKFSSNSHYLFGISGPVRIIGQCKMHKSPAKLSNMKEFVETLNEVHKITEKMKSVLPDWFRTDKGPILGWFISHSGFQSGAVSKAQTHGIVYSDSRDLTEIMTFSRKIDEALTPNQRVAIISDMIKSVLENFEKETKATK